MLCSLSPRLLITYNCNGLDARWILATRKNYCAKAFARAKLSAFRLPLCSWPARSRLHLIHAPFVAPRVREGGGIRFADHSLKGNNFGGLLARNNKSLAMNRFGLYCPN